MDEDPNAEFMKQVMSKINKDTSTAIQDGLLEAFNDTTNNQWIVEQKIEHEVYDFRDLLKRFFWKRT